MNAILITLAIFAILNVAAYFYAVHVFKFAKEGIVFLKKSYETITTRCTKIPDYDDTIKVLKEYDIGGLQEFLDVRIKFVLIPTGALVLNLIMMLYPIAPVLNDSWIGYILIAALVVLNGDSIILHRNLVKVKRMIDYRCELYNQLIIAHDQQDGMVDFYSQFTEELNKLFNNEEESNDDHKS